MRKCFLIWAPVLLLASLPLSAQFSIDTMPAWNGTTFISSFGVVNTATYGQTITVVPGNGHLLSFSFQVGNCSAAVNFRAHVYAWDGTKATGTSLFDSALTSVPQDALFHLVSFNTGLLTLAPGQYVLFASTSEDQTGALNSACRWGSVGNSYPGGTFVYINNGAVSAQWTTNIWSTIASDLAFQASFDGTAFAVPSLSEWGMIVLGCLLAGAGYCLLHSRSKLALST